MPRHVMLRHVAGIHACCDLQQLRAAQCSLCSANANVHGACVALSLTHVCGLKMQKQLALLRTHPFIFSRTHPFHFSSHCKLLDLLEAEI